MAVNLAKACSRRPEDAWVGEVFLTTVGALLAFVLWGRVFCLSVWALMASLDDGSPYAAAVWLIASLGFPVAAGGGWRLVRGHTHSPVARRLYVLGMSGGLLLWSGVIVALFFGVVLIAIVFGQAALV